MEHDFSIFNEVLIERRASPTDPIVACTIVIADPIIQSLNDKHFTCLNHALMQELSTIGGAILYAALLPLRDASTTATIWTGLFSKSDTTIFAPNGSVASPSSNTAQRFWESSWELILINSLAWDFCDPTR